MGGKKCPPLSGSTTKRTSLEQGSIYLSTTFTVLNQHKFSASFSIMVIRMAVHSTSEAINK